MALLRIDVRPKQAEQQVLLIAHLNPVRLSIGTALTTLSCFARFDNPMIGPFCLAGGIYTIGTSLNPLYRKISQKAQATLKCVQVTILVTTLSLLSYSAWRYF
jgi:hypothetical protein